MCKWSYILSILAPNNNTPCLEWMAKNRWVWILISKRGLPVDDCSLAYNIRTVGIVQYNVARKYCVGTLPDINSTYHASFLNYKSWIHRSFMHIHILSRNQLSPNMSLSLLSLSLSLLSPQVHKISHSGHLTVLYVLIRCVP